MILCLGYYNRGNLGDDIFHIIFNNIFDKIGVNYLTICMDDCKEIPSEVNTIILGGGEILNSYFLLKLKKLCTDYNFSGKIIAYSCELPQGDIIPEVNLIDWFILRNKNDVIRLQNYFNTTKFIEYY